MKQIPYTLFKSLLLLVFMTGCSEFDLPVDNKKPKEDKEDKEDKIDKIEIGLKSIDDFKINLSTIEIGDDLKFYKATVLNNIPTDSLDLATLIDWQKKTASAPNVETNWDGHGIHVNDNNAIYVFKDWENAGNPLIVRSPEGLMPMSADELDSLLYVARDYNLAISRPYVMSGPKAPGYYEIKNMHELRANLPVMRADNEPFVLNLNGNLTLWNADVPILGATLELLKDRPDIDFQGAIKLMPAFDSVNIPTKILQMVGERGGIIIKNGTNAIYLDRYEDYVAMKNVFSYDVYLRTKRSDDFSNLERVFPDTLRLTKDSAEFSAEIIKLKKRPSDWRAALYVLTSGDCRITVKDESAFAHIVQPSVPAMIDYPNPKVFAATNPNYSDIFLDKNSQGWTVGIGHDLSGRVFGYNDGKNTKLRTRNNVAMNDLGIKHNVTETNQREYISDVKYNLTVVIVNKYNLPLEHPILRESGDESCMYKFFISAKKTNFVIPDDIADGVKNPEGGKEKFEADQKILQYISGECIKILDRFITTDGLGSIPPNLGSVLWFSYSDYLKWLKSIGA